METRLSRRGFLTLRPRPSPDRIRPPGFSDLDLCTGCGACGEACPTEIIAIAEGAPNAEGAHKFIDYMIDPTFYVKWATEIGAPASASKAAMSAMPESDDKNFYLDQASIDRLQFMAPLTDEERQKYSDLWTKVKTAFAQ